MIQWLDTPAESCGGIGIPGITERSQLSPKNIHINGLHLVWRCAPDPSVRVRVTEEPSPRSGRLKVAHGASRGNAARPYQGAPAGARDNGSSPPCSVRPRFNHGRSGTHWVMRITGPPGLSETSRFSFSSSRQAATGKRLKRPCRGWKSFGHTYPRLAPWATFKRPLRGLGSSVADKLTDGLGSTTELGPPALRRRSVA